VHQLQNGLRQKIQASLIFWIIAIVSIALDQLSKSWVLAALAPKQGDWTMGPLRTVPVIGGWLKFRYAENRGAAFSLFNEHPEILTGVALILAVAVLIWALFYTPVGDRLSRVALGLVFGGAVGNLVDRFRLGYVVDFIVAHYKVHEFPTFNIADSAICVGIGLLFLASFRMHQAMPTPPAAAQEEETGNG
jgi:signal peptidase II